MSSEAAFLPSLGIPAPVIRVFVDPQNPVGGNPAPVWLAAESMTDSLMQALARASGHESVFVLPAHDKVHRWRMRYFVPQHEMEMCGHATLAALWLLYQRGAWDGSPVAIQTLSGTVQGRMSATGVEISQPRASIQAVSDVAVAAIAQCLGITVAQIIGPVLNASTSRVKTLIRVDSEDTLHTLRLIEDQVRPLCDRLESTGLYPYTLRKGADVSARQFPRSSGYVEDPATGIAAAALAWGLRAQGLVAEDATIVQVHQGEAMGSPSLINVRLPACSDLRAPCWLGGLAAAVAPTSHTRQ